MRTIKIPLSKIIHWINNPHGRCLLLPVKVGWPELQLTQDQVLANALARVNLSEIPYPDNSFISIEVEK